MIETPITERLNYSAEPVERQSNGLTPSIGILTVLCVLAALWQALGGVTMSTTVNIVISIPAWLMFVGGFGIVVAAVFGARMIRDAL